MKPLTSALALAAIALTLSGCDANPEGPAAPTSAPAASVDTTTPTAGAPGANETYPQPKSKGVTPAKAD